MINFTDPVSGRNLGTFREDHIEQAREFALTRCPINAVVHDKTNPQGTPLALWVFAEQPTKIIEN